MQHVIEERAAAIQVAMHEAVQNILDEREERNNSERILEQWAFVETTISTPLSADDIVEKSEEEMLYFNDGLNVLNLEDTEDYDPEAFLPKTKFEKLLERTGKWCDQTIDGYIEFANSNIVNVIHDVYIEVWDTVTLSPRRLHVRRGMGNDVILN